MAEDELPEQSSLISDEFHVTLDMARSFASSIKERGPIKSEECYSFRGDTLLYLFNYEDGWIVLSSDTRIDLVVASDDKGRMEFNQLLNSEDDLLNYSLEGTEDFYDYDIGLQENGGNSYTYDSYSTYSSSFLMNWGANGQYDSSEYSTLPSTWQANGKYYQYDAQIFYNFR